MINFNNHLAFINIHCCVPLHLTEIILERPSWGWISRIFGHWATCVVVFLFITMRSFYDFSQDEEFPQCFIIHSPARFLFSLSEWGHLGIWLRMMNFNNISSFTNVRCSFSVHQNEMILEIVWRRLSSIILNHWATSDVRFSVHQLEITLEFPWARWISKNILWLRDVLCSFFRPQNAMISKFL